MEHFVFRPINLVNIATAVGKDARDMRLTTHGDGVMEIDMPDLTASNRVTLRALFAARGLVEESSSDARDGG